MKRVYLTWCLMGVGAVVVLLLAVGVQAGTIFAAGAVLLCPLMMIFGMGMFGRGMVHHGHHSTTAESDHPTTTTSKPTTPQRPHRNIALFGDSTPEEVSDGFGRDGL